MNLKSLIASTISVTFITLSTSSFATNYLEHKTYTVSDNEMPYANELVNQWNFRNIYSFRQEEYKTSSKWWMCGHSAFATAMNILRTKPAEDLKQLEWFHQKLLAYPDYKNHAGNPHRISNGDQLAQVVNKRDEFSVSKRYVWDRTSAKKMLHQELLSDDIQAIIALTKIDPNYAHFVVIHEIKYDPNGTGGGYVKFSDPSGGKFNQIGYTAFLNGMDTAGNKGQFSIWLMKKTK